MRPDRLYVYAVLLISLSVLYGCGRTSLGTGIGGTPTRPDKAPVCPVAAADSGPPTTIGNAGGTVRVKNHRLDVPAGSVPAPTPFMMTSRSADYVFIDVQPDGQRFDKPAKLTLSYSGCTGQAVQTGRLFIVRWNVSTKSWDEIPSTLNNDSSVSAALDHLSGYALAGN